MLETGFPKKVRLKKCPICNGRGTVPWSTRYAADANGQFSMSGEIRIENISVCRVCHGTGMR